MCNRHQWAEVGAGGGEERLQLGWGRAGSTGWPVQRLPRGYGPVGQRLPWERVGLGFQSPQIRCEGAALCAGPGHSSTDPTGSLPTTPRRHDQNQHCFLNMQDFRITWHKFIELSGLGKMAYAKQKQCRLPVLVLCCRHSFAMNTVKAREYIYLNFFMLYVIYSKYMQCINKL